MYICTVIKNTNPLNQYFIIESDVATIKTIKGVLEDFPSMNYSGSVDNYKSAIDLVLQKKPNLIFLNIDNASHSVTEFISDINEYMETVPYIVALSSTKVKAYEAIKLNCIDFVLTPASELEVRKSTLKFKKKLLTSSKRTICIKSYKDYQYIPVDDILFLKADNNTTDFHLNDGRTITAYKTLKTFEDILPNNFLRIHKSYIINMDYVTRVNYGKNSCTLKKAATKIPFTKTYSDNIDSLLESLTQTTL